MRLGLLLAATAGAWSPLRLQDQYLACSSKALPKLDVFTSFRSISNKQGDHSLFARDFYNAFLAYGQPIIENLRCACRVRVRSSESESALWEKKKIAFRDKGGLARRLRAVQRQVVRQKFGLSATSIIVLVLALDARPLCFSVALVAISYYNPTSVWEKRARLRRRLRRELGDQLLNQKTAKKPVAPQ